MNKFILTYGRNHKEYFDTHEEAELRANELGRYFTCYIDGIKQNYTY